VDPVQASWISPTFSVIPSDLTCVGTAVTAHRPGTGACAYRAQVALNVTVTRGSRCFIRLPIGIWGSIEPHFIRCTPHVKDTRLRLIYALRSVLHDSFPVRGISHGVHRNSSQITVTNQVLQSLRRLLFVVSVIIDHRP